MAEAVVSYALENVGIFLAEQAKFLRGVRDEVEEMKKELQLMQCFLRHADRRQGDNEMFRNLVSQIREASYDVEDVIEHFVLKSAIRSRREQGVLNQFKKCAASINHVAEINQVGSRIESIKTRLHGLRTRLETYCGNKNMAVGSEEGDSSAGAGPSKTRKKQDYAHVIDYNVVGLEHKTRELVDQLLAVEVDDDDRVVAARRSVVSIYGMGGLGKTTLAKKVYGDSRIKAYFESFAWVYLPQQLNTRNVWESILSQLLDENKRKKTEEMKDDVLVSELCEVQKHYKCLVVIDDIWSDQVWEKLCPAFPYLDKRSKSKILITTRNKDVALHADGGMYHNTLDTLNHTYSLELLINTIRYLGGPYHPINVELRMKDHANEMVKQCEGLPLAIVVLGGILATKHNMNEWDMVSLHIKSLLLGGNEKKNNGVTKVLESSYYDLPYNLKSCFLYLSRYPEDYEIKTSQLMQMWIGEGFVSASSDCWGNDGDETMEDVAEQYLNELVSRCLIQAVKRSCTGRVKTCRMHDLMRDLCISKAREENFMHVINLRQYGNETKESEKEKIKSVHQIRRLCVFFNGESSHMFQKDPKLLFCKFPQVRSVFSLNAFNKVRGQDREMESIVKNLKLSRVLDIIYSGLEKISLGKSVTNLLHLRYLSLRAGEIGALSSSMDNLMCLETLVLECVDNHFVTIPDSVWRMEQLRHLRLPRWSRCESGNSLGVGNLRNLQTLVNFPPTGFDVSKHFVKLINFDIVRKLVLISSCWEEVEEIMKSQKLVFNRLHSLSLNTYEHCVDSEAIAEGCPNLYKLCVRGQINNLPGATLRWPSNLVKLVLRLSGLCCPTHMAALGQLQSLKILFLVDNAFKGEEMIFQKNNFPQLQHLVLNSLNRLEAFVVNEGAMPSLSRLEIEDCNNLKSVCDGIQFLKQLKEVLVRNMPYQFRRRLQPGGEDWHKVKHLTSISYL